MSEADEMFETSSVSTKTVKTARFGTWGGRHSNLEGRRQLLEDDDPWPPSLLDWDSRRGTPDGEKSIKSERMINNSASSRRMSDHSTTSSHDADVKSTSSSQNERRLKQAEDLYPKRASSSRFRSRAIANFFHDDFNETMEKMIQDFDFKCSRPLWNDDDEENNVFSRRRRDDDDFFSRPAITKRSLFHKERRGPSLFKSSFDDLWPDRKSSFEEEYAESGIFSDCGSSRLDNRIDEAQKADKSLRQGRRITPKKFEVDIDVQGFQANELLVRTEGRRVVICAKTKQIQEGQEAEPSKRSREFKREFDLPDGVNPYEVTSNLMPDGYLRIEAPVKKLSDLLRDDQATDLSRQNEAEKENNETS